MPDFSVYGFWFPIFAPVKRRLSKGGLKHNLSKAKPRISAGDMPGAGIRGLFLCFYRLSYGKPINSADRRFRLCSNKVRQLKVRLFSDFFTWPV